MAKALLIVSFCLVMLSCSSEDSLQSHLKDYQSRMANVLETEAPATSEISLPNYPSLEKINHQVTQQKIKLFEFYQLKHCALYSLVAERNTSLGRVQLPSTRYLYERSLLLALEECIAQTEEPLLKTKMLTWHTAKKENIEASWASLMQFSSELKRAFSSHTGTITGSKKDGLVQIKQALNYLVKISQNPAPSSVELEKHLKILDTNPLPAKLWFSQLMLTEYLEKLTPWLIENVKNERCLQGQNKVKIEYLRNVFQLFFIEKIQPIAGQLNHYHYQLSPIFDKIIDHPELSDDYKLHIQILHYQGFDRYKNAMQQHIKFWQRLFKACNLSPTKN